MRAICAILILAAGIAADDGKPKKTSKRDPRVLELIKQAADLYKNAKSVQVELAVAFNLQNGDEKQEIQSQCVYDLEKPDHFSLRARQAKDKDAGIDCTCDGKTLVLYALKLKQYTESAAPKSLSEISLQFARVSRANTGFLFLNLLADDPYESLVDDVISCTYAGKEKVAGFETHHVKVVHPEVKWEAWIAAEGKPLVLKATTLVAVDEYRATTVETYENWKLDQPIDKKVFSFTVPADAEKVDVLGQSKRKK
ncbi:MAG TPA: DUF2092 domain-containing protein [Gemmataceae bacterium]|nr:DUF2092 domain-containing protein [Gemmataceae bacterium]